MKKILVLKLAMLWLAVNLLPVSGQSGSLIGYPSGQIADSLKANANAVLREEMTEYTFVSQELNVLKHRKVITVLNKNGDDQASFVMHTDQFRKITYCRGNIYDAEGKLIRKIKPSEITDIPKSVGLAEFLDIRYRFFEPLISIYPYTVEFEYEIQMSGSLFFPDWMAFEDFNVSIEKTEFKVVVPENYQLRYKEFNMDNLLAVSSDGKNKTYSWTVKNMKAFDEEPYYDKLNKYVGAVYTAPTNFTYSGYSGKMDTWNDYAKWIAQLNEGRDILSEERILEIKELIKSIKDDREIVKKLYTYMQQKTRYFNVSLGIGGLQPALARHVDEVGYGDCKGLSNYMKALLKVAGIESNYTLVLAGGTYPSILPDFPSQQFNHVILCVPLKGDTIWLECTSQIIPFGFLGDFTSDRHVLLINNDGGKMVRTPAYTLDENIQITKADVQVTPDGNGTAVILRKFGGLQFYDMSAKLHVNPDDQKEWLYNYIKLPNYQINKFSLNQRSADSPESLLDMNVKLNNYGSLSGKRMFLPLNLVNRNRYIPPKLKQRRFDIILKMPYIDSDSIEFTIPEGMGIEFLPEEKIIKSSFGEYVSKVTIRDNKIIYYRQIKMYKGTYPKDIYEDLIKFYREISVADNCQAILIKKES